MNERNIRKLIILIFGEQHMTNFFYLLDFIFLNWSLLLRNILQFLK